tara:strand:+ start:347 stop:979 length:633 start_codon:yes stop_codon:yes gene_type:complete
MNLTEVAPPSAKHERMIKHIKKGYAKDGKLTKREKSIAYATAWKHYKKENLDLEIPSTPEAFSAGLMFRESLGKDSGMLFVFKEAGEKSFHMTNTTIPLDIAFINEDGIIESIKELKPLDETHIFSDARVLYAIEVNRGWFTENNVRVGDKVLESLKDELLGNARKKHADAEKKKFKDFRAQAKAVKEKGIKFYDKKGSGRIVNGKKVYK